MGHTYISISIYQPYLVPSENTPQEISIDVIKNCEKNAKPGGIYNEPVLYNFINF